MKRFMENQMGHERGSALVGRSVHNQRIERLWRDVYVKVLDRFYRLFHFMECQQILDIENDIHLYALHFVFLPRIDRELMLWNDVHNYQGIRTMSYQYPLNVWYNGVLRNLESNSSAIHNIRSFNISNSSHDVLQEFGIDWDLSDPPDHIVTVPNVPNPLTDEQNSTLHEEIDPLSESQHDGIDIYGQVVLFIRSQTS